VKAQDYASTAKTEAVTETGQNTAAAINNLNLDTKLSTADTKAQDYASTAESNANQHTDAAIKKLEIKSKDSVGTALKVANDNTERRAVIAENNAVARSEAYMNESSGHTLESANTYTNHRAVQAENNSVARSNNYTDNRFGELRKSLEHTEKRLNAGIAGVTAMSSIPYAAGNNFSYGIGAGNYKNGNAVAAGVQLRVSPLTNVRLNISWDSAGNNATGVGIAGGW
ncbi:hypothetical protein FNI05_22990, partial [Salmonella enterica subsp. diarizonae]|nr:hypothetical protein [Salmonella enterica subsp. enterica]ECJ2493757.1 hypothetical protein [Salmonella enterica subsp. diarizonae]ECP4390155.1 hypothetical protein [Salmonella enterica]ECP8567518.1 hypothetical protein [Salmonella enterica subsp. enterica serovar Java]EDN5753200.1 hypothetical protein [Salmonella enterica subsp. diarizonae serovar 48:i:z]